MTGGSSTTASVLQVRRSHSARVPRVELARNSLRSFGPRGVPTAGGLLASDLDAFGASRLGVVARWGGECTPRSSAQPFRVKVDWDPSVMKSMLQQ